MKHTIELLLALILLGSNVTYSQTYKTILQHPLLSLDSSTLENLSYDSLDAIISDYEDQVNSCLREGYSFYPCEQNQLFFNLIAAKGAVSNNRLLFLNKMLEMCVDMQNEIRLQDDSLIVTVESSKKILPKVYQEDFKDALDDLENGFDQYKRDGGRTLFIQEKPKPSPLHFLSIGLYPVGIAIIGLGIHGLQELNKDNNGSGVAYGAGILYFFDAIFIAMGTVPIGGATLTLVNFNRKNKNYNEYKAYTSELKEEFDTLKIIEY